MEAGILLNNEIERRRLSGKTAIAFCPQITASMPKGIIQTPYLRVSELSHAVEKNY